MGMVVQHNVSAMNANNAMSKNVAGLKKQTEKLSTGYNINRAADNAAGLAISEKMRSQIRGLTQATSNANDAISLIQTAEGGLQETEDIMQRMRELAVQSANGTYTDEDREQIQYEVDALKEEVDRISQSTEYNEMKLLDGSLGGVASNNSQYGAKYGNVEDDMMGTKITTTSSIEGVQIKFTTGASGKGGENAVWKADGKTLLVNLDKTQSYSDDEINELIKNASQQKTTGQTAPIPDLTYKTEAGVISGSQVGSSGQTTTATAAGLRSTNTAADVSALMQDGAGAASKKLEGYGDKIQFTANTYGKTGTTEGTFAKIKIVTDVAAGKEEAKVTSGKERTYGSGAAAEEIEMHLATGVTYSEDDLSKILAKAGYDYSVDITDDTNPDGADKLMFNKKDTTGVTITMTDGAGVGKEAINGSGEGLTFQIGANGVEDQRLTVNVDDMSSAALGIKSVSVAKQDDANTAINKIDDAIKTVSTQRAKLGAVQNRLEHTVNSLNTANENMTASESQIRDTDMASEMIKYTKSNILQQASQSMLAQANQQPQGVLQLLG
jgi:flagellin